MSDLILAVEKIENNRALSKITSFPEREQKLNFKSLRENFTNSGNFPNLINMYCRRFPLDLFA